MVCIGVDRKVDRFSQDVGTGSVCYELTKDSRLNIGFFVLIMPNFLRFAQNMRKFIKTGKLHPCVTNACKYLLGMLITILVTFHTGRASFLLVLSFISAIYSFLWDTFMDWGLFKANSHVLCVPCGRCRLRRRRLLSTRKCTYIAGVIMNFCARFFYLYTLVPFDAFEHYAAGYHGASYGIVRICFFTSPSIEVLRRSMWTAFSFEYKWIEKSKHVSAVRTNMPESRNVGAGAVNSWYLKVELIIICGLGVMLAMAIILTGIYNDGATGSSGFYVDSSNESGTGNSSNGSAGD